MVSPIFVHFCSPFFCFPVLHFLCMWPVSHTSGFLPMWFVSLVSLLALSPVSPQQPINLCFVLILPHFVHLIWAQILSSRQCWLHVLFLLHSDPKEIFKFGPICRLQPLGPTVGKKEWRVNIEKLAVYFYSMSGKAGSVLFVALCLWFCVMWCVRYCHCVNVYWRDQW